MNDFVGKECFFIDRVTFKKLYDGRALGICLEVAPSREKGLLAWFEKPFLGFTWIEIKYIRITKKPQPNA